MEPAEQIEELGEEERFELPLDLAFVEFRLRNTSLRLVRADTIIGFTVGKEGPMVFLSSEECLLLHPTWNHDRFKSEVLGPLNLFIVEDANAIRSV